MRGRADLHQEPGKRDNRERYRGRQSEPVQWNGFGDDETATALGVALEVCGSLEAVNLAHNRLGLRAASLLARGLERRGGAVDLDLDGNPIGRWAKEIGGGGGHRAVGGWRRRRR